MDDNEVESDYIKKERTHSSRVVEYRAGRGFRDGEINFHKGAAYLPQFFSQEARSDTESQSLTILEENTPLLDDEIHHTSNSQNDESITIAAIFLKDYEQGREPTLASLDAITNSTLRYHKICYSKAWRVAVHLAVMLQFVAAAIEGDSSLADIGYGMSLVSMAIFLVDLGLRHKILHGSTGHTSTISSMRLVDKAMLCFIGLQTSEVLVCMLRRALLASIGPRFLCSSIFKPVVLFYVSEKSRNAMQALAKIAPIVSRVLALELLLILSFAAVACRLYSHFSSFANLGKAWLSLFQLSTTVVNPSMWMPMYEASKRAAFFFVLFDTATTLYLHSLVLSVVFQTYIQASTEIHDLTIVHKEEAMKLSFQALCRPYQHPEESREEGSVIDPKVSTQQVRSVLERLRPHYSSHKINALMSIYDDGGMGQASYSRYRTNIHSATRTSIRTAADPTGLAYIAEALSRFVAITNFSFVIMLTTKVDYEWFNACNIPIGFSITLLGLLELLIRTDPFRIWNTTPITKLNATFDGIALLAGMISCYGLVHYEGTQTDFLLTGRAVDMIRIMRFQKIFRDVIQRSGEVMPALVGPLCLVLATNHLFVYAGMAIWGGAIDVGRNSGITPLYDQNNFNSYWEGMVTMFNVLIVNDWHAISEVYTHASWNSNAFIVYGFFVLANLISVNVMLNCLVAFFVGAFVTGVEDEPGNTKQFKIDTSNRSLRRVSSSGAYKEASTRSGTSRHSSKVVDFDVFERTSYDKIMRTVSGGAGGNAEAYAKDICEKLELFEALSGQDGPKRGFLTCCQQSMNRFGNRRFQTMLAKCMEVNDVHSFVSDVHSSLLFRENDSIHRLFATSDGENISIEASLIRQNPPVSLLVASYV